MHFKPATVLDWRTRCGGCRNICKELYQWADGELEGAGRGVRGRGLDRLQPSLSVMSSHASL